MDTLAFLEAAAEDWWERLNREEQEVYIKAHPHTKMKVNQTSVVPVSAPNKVPKQIPLKTNIPPVKKEDIEDARGVLKDWSLAERLHWMGANIDRVFDDALAKAKVEQIPIATGKFNIFHDWGRRPKSNNPIITLRQPDGTQFILDGQHRYLTLKEAGAKAINTLALDIPLIRTAGGKLMYKDPARKG